jgi:hypothetical protein
VGVKGVTAKRTRRSAIARDLKGLHPVAKQPRGSFMAVTPGFTSPPASLTASMKDSQRSDGT